MSIMDDILATDAMAFTNSDEFGETIQFRATSDANPRSIVATVYRNPPAMALNLPDTGAPLMLVSVQNNATRGISDQEINMGLNALFIKEHVGDTEYRKYRITVIEKQDAGMLLLQVR